MKTLILIIILSFTSVSTHARKPEFRVIINGATYTQDAEFTPCFPLQASFEHDNLSVTKVRNEYPTDPSKFFMYSLHDRPFLEFHEKNMKANMHPYMDWVAEDYKGNEYGRIRMMFIAPENPNDNQCDRPVS